VGSKSEKDPVDPQIRSGESDNRSLKAAEAKHSIADVKFVQEVSDKLLPRKKYASSKY
jgi:hypothetical protein